MPQSNSVNVIAPALAKAQAKFEKISKNRVGQEGSQKFPYSTLSAVLEAVKPPLNEMGIFLSQPIIIDDKGDQRVTTKVQLGDEFISTDGVLLTRGLVGSKAFGREVTYSKRYDLMSFMGVCAEEDDADAPDCRPSTPLTPYKPASYKPTPAPVTKPAEVKLPDIKPLEVKVKPTDFPFGANTVEGIKEITNNLPNRANPEITEDDLPKEMFDDHVVPQEAPLSEEAENCAAAMDSTLSQDRYNHIQDRLKEIADKKLAGITRKGLAGYLDARHGAGVRLVYVPAKTAEETLKLIESAIEAGPPAVKELFNGLKEKA